MNIKFPRRQCYFQDERYLRYFKVYTQSNCELECLTNYTLHKCGCVKFYMPRNSSTPVCGLGMYNCYKSAEHELIFKEVNSSIIANCKCLLACTMIDYNSNIHHIKNNFDIFKFRPGLFIENE